MRLLASASTFALFLGCSSGGEAPLDPVHPPGSAGTPSEIDAAPGGSAGSGGASEAGVHTGGSAGAAGAGGTSGTAGGEAGSAGTDAGAADAGGGTGGAADAGPPGDAGAMPEARQLALGPDVLVGMTDDGHAVYWNSAGRLHAKSLIFGSPGLSVAETPGSVLIAGKVVFTWADVDWTTNLGILRIWTPEGGTLEVGVALYAEDMVAASEDGKTVVYNVNVAQKSTDLVIARTDAFLPRTLIAGLGRGSADTCRAHFGFVAGRLLVGSCPVGSQTATLVRYEDGANGWTPTTLATGTLPSWSADRSGERIFFQSSDYRALYLERDKARVIDNGVSGGMMLPDGSGVFYNVGDQLRRTALPEINPVPVVTRGFVQRAEFSPAYDHVLYSRQVTYEGGTKRDLLLTDTHGFNPAPRELVAEPIATLSRSVFTSDGKYVLYLTGSTLHALSIASGAIQSFDAVDTVVAARGSRIVFSDHRSDPQLYPIVADLKTVDLAGDAAPALIEAKIDDGRSFYLSPEKDAVVYVRSGVDRDRADPAASGVFVRTLPSRPARPEPCQRG